MERLGAEDRLRLSMMQSSLEVLGKQSRFFMCCDACLARKICVQDKLKIPCLALIVLELWFSRDLGASNDHSY